MMTLTVAAWTQAVMGLENNFSNYNHYKRWNLRLKWRWLITMTSLEVMRYKNIVKISHLYSWPSGTWALSAVEAMQIPLLMFSVEYVLGFWMACLICSQSQNVCTIIWYLTLPSCFSCPIIKTVWTRTSSFGGIKAWSNWLLQVQYSRGGQNFSSENKEKLFQINMTSRESKSWKQLAVKALW